MVTGIQGLTRKPDSIARFASMRNSSVSFRLISIAMSFKGFIVLSSYSKINYSNLIEIVKPFPNAVTPFLARKFTLAPRFIKYLAISV